MAQNTQIHKKIEGKSGVKALPINKETIDEIKQAFELFIPDKQTTVRPVDMCRVFEKLGMNQSMASIYNMVKFLDNSYNNELGLTFEEFMDQACDFFNQRDSHEGISRIFSLFDNS